MTGMVGLLKLMQLLQNMFVGVSLIEDIGEDSSLLESKRGEAERLTELLGSCLRQSGVAGFTFL